MGNKLNKALWNDEDSLRDEVQQKLLDIATDFVNAHIIHSEAITDITLTGSLANYNWNEYSDIDLHILVDYDKMDSDEELLSHYYRLAKSVWNADHEIEVCGHEVEIYVQNDAEPHHSTGVYSLSDNEWVNKPVREREQPTDTQAINKKHDDLAGRIEDIENKAKSQDSSALNAAEKLKEKIRKMRKAGLESGGEYSVENLAFKKLRNGGYLGRLSDAAKLAYDNQYMVTNCPQ